MTLQNIIDHGKSKEHDAALKKLRDSVAQPKPAVDLATAVEGQVSGLSSQVPRVDRFVAVATSIINYDTYASYQERVQQLGVHSSLEVGGKGSKSEFKQILACLDGPLQDRNRRVMKRAICSSIALDKSADNFILIARMLIPEGIFDCILGLQTDVGPDVADAAQAIRNIAERATIRHVSSRDPKAGFRLTRVMGWTILVWMFSHTHSILGQVSCYTSSADSVDKETCVFSVKIFKY